MSEQILHNRYGIKRQLGKKAGRRTLLASDQISQKLVIIKLLTFSSDFAWENLKLFEREAETLKTLNHPAIPKYIDYFELDGAAQGYALVQSYVEGKSLEEYIQTGRLFTEKEVKIIALQLLKILIYLHSQHPPVIHRDLKPSNIILLENGEQILGQIYLVDFGSVQTLVSKAGKTVTVVGTYGYMPPEQFGGYATGASDLYSLGATLIALATGIHPADLPQKEMRIAFADLVDFSPGLVDWLQWLTEPSVERRLNSATEALATLEKLDTQFCRVHQQALIKPVNTVSLFVNALLRSTFVGGGMITLCAALYSSIVLPILGTILGGVSAAMVAFPLGLANGVLIGLITRLFFYPLNNAHRHRLVLSMTSTIIGTVTGLIYFGSLGLGGAGHQIGISSEFQQSLFFAIAPSLITGLSMGTVSKSFAQWYEKENRRRKYLKR
ncbi:serine/threonine-protein kinase [Calothrix sp. UHCC 0171]|uniref:serine/threonine protein kinase n=1 Tax=Calothrix sp. UHCC 0171 TaxID=3110245 RepID=UPI002B1FD806|nr:serine/threonine-protein kinase [Calothrix sp. UHCC 0171]MEA5572740.1 serine/threonine-protein kinase [Calothrix sp. UHCC 0171]